MSASLNTTSTLLINVKFKDPVLKRRIALVVTLLGQISSLVLADEKILFPRYNQTLAGLIEVITTYVILRRCCTLFHSYSQGGPGDHRVCVQTKNSSSSTNQNSAIIAGAIIREIT
jgi:hypothetical protein